MKCDDGLTLGELIIILERLDKSEDIRFGFCYPHSYRGFYDFLAFEPKWHTTIGDMLLCANESIGMTFEGWKGGYYTMRPETPVYFAESGNTGIPITKELLDVMLRQY